MSRLTRILNLFRGRALDREFDDELRFHLAERRDELVRRGGSPWEAEQVALEHFGDFKETKRQLQEVRMVGRQFLAGVMVGIIVVAIPAGIFRLRHAEAPTAPNGFYLPGVDGVEGPKLV